MKFPLKHPPYVISDLEAERFLKEQVLLPGPPKRPAATASYARDAQRFLRDTLLLTTCLIPYQITPEVDSYQHRVAGEPLFSLQQGARD